ncbi:hypothetical protein [Aeromonas veronii]|uniref:hypothetical protein n=1 Tax=Aeromonas veronii TaxID=654 RepID=UPI0011161DF9|nr:hypothetical protein [Aeromonas veronii]
MNEKSKQKMELREVVELEISQLPDYSHAPERVCILLPESISKGAFDIGIIAYSVRGMSSKPNNTNLQPVCFSSLNYERQEFLILLFDHLSTKGWRDSSVLAFLKSVRTIVNWADSTNHTDLFSIPDYFRTAYIDFTNHLTDQILHRKIKPNTANQIQRSMKVIAKINFGKDIGRQIISGIITIPPGERDLDAPEKAIVKENVNIFTAILKGYGNAVIEMQPYPWLLKTPDYHTYVFPAGSSIKTPFTTNHITNFNYEEGRLLTAEEMIGVNSHDKARNVQNLKEAQKNIDKHNKLGLNSLYRKLDISMALSAYMQLFMLTTGCYKNEARQIIYESKVDIERDIVDYNFRAVKFRAGGKVVSYKLGSKYGLELFKFYLKLREFFLQGKTCNFLFFNINKNGEPVQYTERTILNLVARSRKLFFPANINIVHSREARKFKSVTFHEAKIGTKTAAKSLNHTERTNETYYIPSSPDTSKRELSTLWSAIKKAANEIKITTDMTEIDVSIPTGHCSNIGSPTRAQEDTPIDPDCKKQFGCLFCSKYIIHADHDDIHKLLSVRYVIEQVLRMSNDPEKSEKLLRELSVRIDYLIERLKNFSNATKKLINKLYVDVFEYGELTTFWSFRLERYAEMGMIL